MGARSRTIARAGRLAVVLACVCLASPFSAQTPAAPREGVVHALLINGGNQPASNYLSHLQHLQGMVDVLERRGVPRERIHVFSADGEEPAADLATRNTAPRDFWLVDGTSVGTRLSQTTQIDTVWPGVKLHPARLEGLRRWFDQEGKQIQPGDRLLVFVTDHGGEGKERGTGTIWLWREPLTVREMRTLLARLAPGVQVVNVMSQCYSGAFADLMYDRGDQEPSGDTCGFFATSANDKAYGCYAEGQARDRVGFAFEFIAALDRQPTALASHFDVTQSDRTPDRPRTTSDAYLARTVGDEAAARGIDADELTDSLLAAAWRRHEAWEPEIRRLDGIGESFGTFSPRSLRELKSLQSNVTASYDRIASYSARWTNGFVAAKEALLRSFFDARPEWRDALEPRLVTQLSADARSTLLDRFLGDLQAFARQSTMWAKLERFRDTAAAAKEAEWRFEVRKAAVDRMRTILVSIAGRELLADTAETSAPGSGASRRVAQRATFDALARCEAFAPGTLNRPATPPARSTTRWPLLDEDSDRIQNLQPSWFGVRYAPVPAALRNAFPSLGGAAHIQSVDTDSPAAAAGLAAGDVILGPPSQPFKTSADVMDWTLTSPRDAALPLKVFRLDQDGASHREFEVSVSLRPLEVRRSDAISLRVGAPAPVLPTSMKSARVTPLADLQGRAHLRFFWATWCAPCKASIPEVMAFAAARNLPVVAITDEDEATVSKFLSGWTRPFFDTVAIDPYRMTFLSHGVSGTPTIVLVDADGAVRFRQVGYSGGEGLTVQGWRWTGR